MRGRVGEARLPPIAARAPRFAGREPASCAACVRRGFGERPATARAFAIPAKAPGAVPGASVNG